MGPEETVRLFVAEPFTCNSHVCMLNAGKSCPTWLSGLTDFEVPFVDDFEFSASSCLSAFCFRCCEITLLYREKLGWFVDDMSRAHIRSATFTFRDVATALYQKIQMLRLKSPDTDVEFQKKNLIEALLWCWICGSNCKSPSHYDNTAFRWCHVVHAISKKVKEKKQRSFLTICSPWVTNISST
jgi:hypothetical protein